GLKAKQLSLEGPKGHHGPQPSLANTVKVGPHHHLPTKTAAHTSSHSHIAETGHHVPKLTAHQPELSRSSQIQRVEAPRAVQQTQADAGQQPADAAAQGDASATDATSNYTVQSGDSLWDIAKQHLGDGSRWHEIYNLN